MWFLLIFLLFAMELRTKTPCQKRCSVVKVTVSCMYCKYIIHTDQTHLYAEQQSCELRTKGKHDWFWKAILDHLVVFPQILAAPHQPSSKRDSSQCEVAK